MNEPAGRGGAGASGGVLLISEVITPDCTLARTIPTQRTLEVTQQPPDL